MKDILLFSKNKGLRNILILFMIIILSLGICACNAHQRLIKTEGAYNIRDLGGYSTDEGKKVKWGLLYRAGDLVDLTDRDIKKLNSLGIKTVVDFRSIEEINQNPDKLPDSVNKSYLLSIDFGSMANLTSSIDINKGEEMMRMFYEGGIRDAQPEYVEFFKILSDPVNLPLLFHCSAGKDRTGIGAALFLSAIGVDREVIYDDYMMSAEYVREKYAKLVEEQPELAATMTVKREYLEAAFNVIDKEYGGIENYLINYLNVNIPLMRSIYTE